MNGPNENGDLAAVFLVYWGEYFNSDDPAIMQAQTENLKQKCPWLCATPEQARCVATCAIYPRSRLGSKQSDWLLRVIYLVRDRYPGDINGAAREIVEILTAPRISLPDEKYTSEGSFFWLIYRFSKSLGLDGSSFQPKTGSELFGAIADGLLYLEDYKPTARDYAIEALQGSFVGLMQSNYLWGKKGTPSKGEVTEMAKVRFQDRELKTDFAKSSWSDLLKAAQLYWLEPREAGRPSKASLDENVKAEREYLSICAQAIRVCHGGDPKRARDAAKAAWGNKAEYRRSEEDRLRDVQPESEQGLE
jgi:hypothetical protein